jgi:hypothetical protein
MPLTSCIAITPPQIASISDVCTVCISHAVLSFTEVSMCVCLSQFALVKKTPAIARGRYTTAGAKDSEPR